MSLVLHPMVYTDSVRNHMGHTHCFQSAWHSGRGQELLRVRIYLTYLTHAFLHADMFHIISNSASLLMFGSVVESQVPRTKFAIIVFLAILAGGTFAMSNPQPAEFYSREPPIGLSAATSALGIVGLCVLAYYWRWGKALLLITLFLSVLLLSAFLFEAFTSAEARGWAIASTALLVVGAWSFWAYWRNEQKKLSALLAIAWLFFPPYELLDAKTWSYGGVAHLAGAITGCFVIFPVLRNEIVSSRTDSLKGSVMEAWNDWLIKPVNTVQVSIEATQSRHSRARSAVMLASLLVVVSALAYSHGQDAYYYYELYFK